MNWIVKPLAGLRIRTKLVGVLVVAMLFVGLAFGGMGHMQQKLSREQKAQLNAETQALLELSELNIGFKTQVQEWKNLLVRGRSPSDYWLKIENSQQVLQQEADEVIASLHELGMHEKAEVVVEFKRVHQALFESYQAGERALAQGVHFTEVDASVRGMDRAPTEMLSDLTFAIDEYRQKSWQRTQAQVKQGIMIGLSLIVASIIFALFVASALVMQTVVRPLERTCDFLGQMAEGDFRGSLPVESQDEMGKLASYTNRLGEQLTKLLKEVERSVHQLSVASEELNQSSEQNVARTKQQQDQTHQMASAMTQMSGSVDEVATHAHQASEKTVQANKQTDEAESILSRTIADLESLDLTLNEAGGAVSRLASESQEIGGILDVIRNIADQTNLLALNAAIEAARAGEQGRGFAVVADEVRSLSLRTQEATAEIQNMIGKLQSGATDAVAAMSEGQEGSRRGLEQTREAGEALMKIHSQLNHLNDMNAHLAAAALEQSHVSTEISGNVQQVRQLGDEVADETQVSQSIAKQLYGNAERLEQQLSRFQLN